MPNPQLVMSRRDLDFLLYEWLDVTGLTTRPRFAEHTRETFDAFLTLSAQLAEREFATHNRRNDAEEPRFDGERPFLVELTPATRRAAERASYFGAYKGVTDLLTRYLWPELALWLTRFAAHIGLSPNAVTLIGAAFCVAATVAFAHGAYWPGMALALVFMVLDTVDGKLARCTVTSSRWGHLFDHGIDLVHPPFWWWFWATGLVHVGLGLSDTLFWWVQGAILGGYVLQRAVEGIFIWQFGGIHIHVWRRFDSRFRLVTARRNPNMAILFASLLVGRPDIGIVAVAVWTAVSFTVHLIRLGQALQRRARGQTISSWLARKDST